MANPNPYASPGNQPAQPPWFRELSSYHWLVLTVATMAWAFDCLSQQIFNLTRKPAMDALTDSPAKADFFGPLGTTALLVGWATGGIIFGILGDRIGRAKTLTIMIVCYSVSTGLCGLSTGPWAYIIFCFITGVGAGGIFPIACTLVAESLPDRSRSQALGMVQTFSALGNIGAGAISLGFVALLVAGIITTHWRWMFSIGIVPSLLAVIVARRLREPEAWKRAAAEGKVRKASLGELFSDRRWGRNAIVGLLLAASGVVGLWGIGVFSNDLTQRFIGGEYDQTQRDAGEAVKDLQFVRMAIRSPESIALARESLVQPRQLLGTSPLDKDAERIYKTALDMSEKGEKISPEHVLASISNPTEKLAEKLPAATAGSSIEEHAQRIIARKKAREYLVLKWAAWTLICFNIGAFFGMYSFARVTQVIGRRPTFAIFFVFALLSTAFAFRFMAKMPQDLWMVALMGAAQLSVFGGYAIYFPELFPTRLRSTGTSFCYNVGRYVSAIGPLGLGLLTPYLVSKLGDPVTAARYAGIAMCSCYLVGLVALLFAPETKGQPLPNKMFERIRQMLIKEFIQVFRDPRMRTVIFIVPCMEVLVIGYAVNMDIRDIRTAIYDLDNTPASRDLLARFSASGYFDVVAHVDDDRQMQDLIDRSTVQIVLRINHGFAGDLEAGRTANVQVICDGTDSNTAGIAMGYVNHITSDYARQMLAKRIERAQGVANPPVRIDFRPRAWFNENLESRNYFVPGVIVIVVSLVSLLLTAMAVVREKEIGTIEQIMVTPITPAEFILGKTLPFVLIAFVDVTLILLIGAFWFEVPLRGSIVLLYFSTGLYLLTMLGVGLFISTVSQTQQQAMMSTFLFFFPAMLLSGFSFPIANMPVVIQWLTYLNPVAYFLVIVRTIFLKGVGLSYLWPHLLALAAMGVATLVLAVRRFHKTL